VWMVSRAPAHHRRYRPHTQIAKHINPNRGPSRQNLDHIQQTLNFKLKTIDKMKVSYVQTFMSRKQIELFF
jgi:uncharacterized protein YbaP (TraB family)